MPPSAMDLFLSGMMVSISISSNTPKPVQVSQAPNGLLKENILGDSSSIDTLCSGQAYFCENSITSPPITSTITKPSVEFIAVSKLSAKRDSMPSLMTSLSTTISMLCFLFLSSFISSERSYIEPSQRTRTYPERLAFSNSFRCSPFLPRTIGASICILVPFSKAITVSVISSTVCMEISLPHMGQCGTPVRAYSNLK